MLRHAFHLDTTPPPDARLYATAHGIYETYPQRTPRRRRRAGPRLHQLPDHAARAGLRRQRPARRRRQPLGGRALRRLVARPHRLLPVPRRLRHHPRLPRPAPRRRHRRLHGGRLGVGHRPAPQRATSWRGRARTTGPNRTTWHAVTVAEYDLDQPDLLPGAADPPHPGAAPGLGDPAAARPPGRRPRAEHQRLAAPQRPRPRRHRAHHRARRVPRPQRRRDPGPSQSHRSSSPARPPRSA